MTGQDIIVILSQGSTVVASAAIRSDEINTACPSIERASATQQGWKEVLAGRKSWSLTLNYLMLAAARLRDVLLIGQMFDVTIRDKSNTSTLTGKALMTGAKQTHTTGNLCQGSFSLEGSGPLQ
jgi:predicted secreted protein